MKQRIAIDRIQLTLDGMAVGEAELLSAQLQSALVAQLRDVSAGGLDPSPGDGESMYTALTGRALVDAIAARLADAIGVRWSDNTLAANASTESAGAENAREPIQWP